MIYDPEVAWRNRCALTARRLRTELVAAWMRKPRTVLLVMHNLIEVKPAHPRKYVSDEMQEIESKVLAVFERTMTGFTPSRTSFALWPQC